MPLVERIPKAKLKALREVLERDGEVTFKNGSVVERVIDEVILGMTGDSETLVHFLVKRPAGGIARYTESEISSAYAMALRGPEPKPWNDGAKLRAEKFGDEVPW